MVMCVELTLVFQLSYKRLHQEFSRFFKVTN